MGGRRAASGRSGWKIESQKMIGREVGTDLRYSADPHSIVGSDKDGVDRK